MEFSEVEKIIKSIFPFLSNNNYDGIIVKKLEPSNTWDSERTTKQTHIAITGEQMNIFPYLSSEGYFNCSYNNKDDALKKFFITMIPIILHKENLVYLGADISDITNFETSSCVIRSRREGAADQIQFALPTYDDKLFILFRQHLHSGYYLILLKRKNDFLYDSVALMDNSDRTKELEQLNNHFYKLPTNTKIDISNFIKIENSNDLTVDDLGKILKEAYTSAGDNQKVVTIHVFGIKFGKLILEKGYKINEIITKAGLNASYATEVSKGVGIYKYIAENLKKTDIVLSNSANEKNVLLRAPKVFYLKHFITNKIHSRYILSLLAKPFVILSGNSGTGKTRIALRFSKYLEKQTDTGINNTLLIPVGADWTDNTKILGYFNPLANEGKGEYVKSEILTFLELANENPSIPFFLILDEMNLSHVERYFSDFLSAMESGKPILLYKKPENCECAVPEKIMLPENLFVTGTVNIDETTYMFSPKVLDRANVIEFKPEMNDVLENLVFDSSSDKEETAEPGVAEGFMQLANKIRSGIVPDGLKAELEKAKPVLESVYQILEKSGFEFAYRTAKEIRLYAAASFETVEDKSQFNINSVIDQQIVQKILPKIHGNKKQIGNLLSELKDELEKHEAFELSRAKVSSMIDKLDKYQYASFI